MLITGLHGEGALRSRRCVAQSHWIEVVRDAGDRLVVSRGYQPHHQKERHERRHEVGVRDFPDTALVRRLLAAISPANDDEFVLLRILFAFALGSRHVTCASLLCSQAEMRVSITDAPA